LAGQTHFVWALLYDLLGTAIGTYGLGVIVAAGFSRKTWTWQKFWGQILLNPPLWSFGLGFGFRALPLRPNWLAGLQALVWVVIFASLILAGMRLTQLSAWQGWTKVLPSLAIKMLLVPLLVGCGLSFIGVTGAVRFVLVLQAAMPPAFSSLVLAEVYHLDQELSVILILLGSGALLLLLPLWLALFGGG
jgi:predicted permease